MTRTLLPRTRNIAKVVISGLGLFFVFALLRRLPVYPDEEQWLYINSRQSIDHLMQYLFPVCENGFRLDQPILWSPIRWLDWLIYSHFSQIMNIRVAGIIQAVLFIIVYSKFLGNFSRNVKEAKAIAFGVFCLGLIPFLLILNRPEQQLTLLFFAALNTSFILKKSTSPIKKMTSGGIFILLVVSMPAIHPKGALFSLAACTISLLIGIRKSGWIDILAITLGVISSINSIQVWSLRTTCEQSEFLSSIFRTITINPTDLHSDSVRMVIGNIIRTPKYLINIFYQENYQSNWLAQESQISIVFQLMADAVLVMAVVFILTSLGRHFMNAIRRKETLNLVDFVSIVFIGMFGILNTLQRTKNFYDSYLPIILLLSAAIIVRRERPLISTKKLKKSLVAGVILSLPAFISTSLNFIEIDDHKQLLTYKSIIQECEITDYELSQGGFIIEGSLTKYFWATPRFVYSNYVWGWWAQDVDADKLIRNLKPPVVIIRNDGTLRKETSDSIVGDFLCRNYK